MDFSLPTGHSLHNGMYRIERVLGQGGFGITYLATDTSLDRMVAIKEFFPKDFCDRDDVTCIMTVGTRSNRELVARLKSKFLKEARTIARLNFPGIIHIFSAFEENDTAYYVMDFIEGCSLSDLVKREGALQLNRALGYIRQVGEALDYIHQRNICHLDVKPANIMVRKADNSAVLIDFGLSKQYDKAGNQTSSTPVGRSKGYAPMEQYKDQGVSSFAPKSDLYSLAATLYCLLSGTVPPDAFEVFGRGLEFPEAFPSELKAPVKKAMSPAEAERQPSVAAFLAELPVVVAESDSGAGKELDIEVEVVDSSQKEKKSFFGKLKKIFTPEPSPEELYNIGFEAKQRGDFAQAFEYFSKSADMGCPEAMNDLGMLYHSGKGVDEDLTMAFNWYKKGAEAGYDFSMYNLALMYKKGLGVPKDEALATHWYLRAAEKGLTNAMINLGYQYEAGLGVVQDYKKAYDWYKKAADQGEAVAMYNVANLLLQGNGVEQNTPEALEWFKKAHEAGDKNAAYAVGLLYYEGKGIEKNLHEAYNWLKKSTYNGDVKAMNFLGILYENGEGVAQNKQEAFKWYEKGARGGEKFCTYNLARCYENGIGTVPNIKKAIEWYHIAADLGDPDAADKLRSLL